jgi:hypothetical protein
VGARLHFSGFDGFLHVSPLLLAFCGGGKHFFIHQHGFVLREKLTPVPLLLFFFSLKFQNTRYPNRRPAQQPSRLPYLLVGDKFPAPIQSHARRFQIQTRRVGVTANGVHNRIEDIGVLCLRARMPEAHLGREGGREGGRGEREERSIVMPW